MEIINISMSVTATRLYGAEVLYKTDDGPRGGGKVQPFTYNCK